MATHEVDIWYWPLDVDAARHDALFALLSEDERSRCFSFVQQRHQRQFAVGRGQLRETLGAYVGAAPADLRFSYNPFGKPAFEGAGPHFNLSHSGGWAALAVCSTAPIGIDIEAFRPIEDGIAKRFFAPAEYATLNALPGHLWQQGFYRCWTRKEAFIKACGPGLSMPLDSFEVTLTPDEPPRFLRIDDPHYSCENWSLSHLDLGPDLVGAVTLDTGGTTPELRFHGSKPPLTT